jgi:type I restriction enzyme S subunit
MSELESLIMTSCPEGVPYKKILELTKLVRGQHMTKDLCISGPFPVVSASREALAFHAETNHPGNAVTVSSHGAYAGYISFWPEEIWLGNNVFLFETTSVIHPRFLYFVLKSRQVEVSSLAKSGGVPYINASQIQELRVPVPPMPVQAEIVRILDKFTELEAELEAELEVRKKQYEHYRNQLLTFEQQGGVRWVPMGEVLSYEQPTKYLVANKDYSEDFKTPVLTAGQTFLLGFTDEKHGVYPADNENPVIIFDDFTAANKWVNFPFKAKSSAMKMLTSKTENLNLRFAFFYLQTIQYAPVDHARQWIGTYSKFEIPLIPLAEQNEIVEILDAFEALVNDISIGLPAELKARRQQYEHYRNQLLTFKEIDAA